RPASFISVKLQRIVGDQAPAVGADLERTAEVAPGAPRAKGELACLACLSRRQKRRQEQEAEAGATDSVQALLVPVPPAMRRRASPQPSHSSWGRLATPRRSASNCA